MTLINRLYSSQFDFDLPVTPRVEYMVATVPRSGSTYFCIELWKLGTLGAPMEYANVAVTQKLLQRFGPTGDLLRYWAGVRCARTSPNGVFGFKMFMSLYLQIANSSPLLLAQLIPEKVIYLTRSDTVAHAISYSKALRTRTWFADDALSRQDIAYDASHIFACEKFIEQQAEFWRSLFASRAITPIAVEYESFVASPASTAMRLSRELGVSSDPASPPLRLPQLEVQRDHVSAEWKRRYIDDRAGLARRAELSLTD